MKPCDLEVVLLGALVCAIFLDPPSARRRKGGVTREVPGKLQERGISRHGQEQLSCVPDLTAAVPLFNEAQGRTAS